MAHINTFSRSGTQQVLIYLTMHLPQGHPELSKLLEAQEICVKEAPVPKKIVQAQAIQHQNKLSCKFSCSARAINKKASGLGMSIGTESCYSLWKEDIIHQCLHKFRSKSNFTRFLAHLLVLFSMSFRKRKKHFDILSHSTKSCSTKRKTFLQMGSIFMRLSHPSKKKTLLTYFMP